MQFFVISLVIALFVHDAHPPTDAVRLIWGVHPLAWLMLSQIVVVIAYAAFCRFTLGRLKGSSAFKRLRRLDRLGLLYRMAVLTAYGASLSAGALVLTRRTIGDWVLVDEAVVLCAPLLMIVLGWWAYYPIDRRLREATLIGQLDRGRPIPPLWTRGQYMVSHLRHQVGLLLVPMLILIAWAESVHRWAPSHWTTMGIDPRPMILLAGSALVFLLCPVIIRHLWDTVPLPGGELRESLLDMCREHRVGLRELLLWRTFGGVINAAVMGIVAPLRYILISDALLEGLRREHIEAVMAHEIAHIRRHHIFWLLATAGVAMGALTVGWSAVLSLLNRSPVGGGAVNGLSDELLDGIPLGAGLVIVLTMASWFVVIGWVSRRFERQADTYAVQHMTRSAAAAGNATESKHRSGTLAIDPAAVHTMVSALQRVTDLNHQPSDRRSWRHGSIAWRQAYLRTLVGKPIDRLAIDGLVGQIKFVTAALLIGFVVLAMMAPPWLFDFLI